MWIRTQDKRTLTKVKHLSICYLNSCYSIFTDNHLAPNERCNLGSYTTLEKAIKVLDMIEKQIRLDTCNTRVFQIPQDNEVE